MKYHIQITSPEEIIYDCLLLKTSDESNARQFAEGLVTVFDNKRIKLFSESPEGKWACVYEINSPTPSYSVIIITLNDSVSLCHSTAIGYDLKKQSTAFNIAKTIMAIPETSIAECLVYKNFGQRTTLIKSFKKEDI